MDKKNKIPLEIKLSEETLERLQVLAKSRQRSLESLIEATLVSYLKEQGEEPDPKIDPIKDTQPAKSWGYNSDVRGK